MAFGQKEINYQEEFGVASKEELKAKLAKIKELEDTHVANTSTITAQAAEIATIKESLNKLQLNNNNNNQNNNNQNNNNNNNNQVEIPSVQDNEDAAFATRLLPIHIEQLNTRAMINEDRVLRELERTDPYFAKLEKETRELIKKTPIQLRGNAEHGEEVIRNAYMVVKGRKATEIINDTRAGKGDFFIEPARSGSAGSSSQQSDANDPNKLSVDEEVLIAKMHLTKEQYLKARNNSNIQLSGALRYA